MKSSKQFIESILELANIHINGQAPWDITVHGTQFYDLILKDPELNFGETYMDSLWDCKQLDVCVSKILSAQIEKKIGLSWSVLLRVIYQRIFNYQSKKKAYEVAFQHYDKGNDLYCAMLGNTMAYTCGYWKNATALDQAQEHKHRLVCEKLMLKPGMNILDIGCGFGAFARYASENYGVKVTGVTVSKKQANFAKELCKNYPIKIELKDYRDITNKFDAIVSLGMFEHVGYKNYNAYMDVAFNALEEHGLFLLHTIGGNVSETGANGWINKYIFPNGMLPSIRQIGEAIEPYFVMEDWHNFGADYDKTLLAWHTNFSHNWHELSAIYGDKFKRMWDYYLLSCAGAFRARYIQLWQIVLSKHGIAGGYYSIR